MNIRRFRRFSLRTWWHWNQPVQCAACRRFVRRQNAQVGFHSVAGKVLLCVECDQRLHSWSSQ